MKYKISNKELEKILNHYYSQKSKSDCLSSITYTSDDREKGIFECEISTQVNTYNYSYEYKMLLTFKEVCKIVSEVLNIEYETAKFNIFNDNIFIEGEEKKMKYENVENLLVVIDMINGFVKEGALAAPSIQRIIPRIKELLEVNEKYDNGLNVIVRDTHTKDSIEFKTFGEHCVEGTAETELVDELKPYAEKAVDFTKNSTNFMLADGVIPFLNNFYKLKRVAFVGCLSEVCVKNAAITARNYFDQTNKDIEVGVYADAIDTFDAPGHNNDEVTERALADMEANGVKVYRK